MQSFTHFYVWLVVFIVTGLLITSIFTYRQQEEFHNARSLLTLGIIAALTLSALLLAIAQTRGILPTKNSSGSLFSAHFLLVFSVSQLAFPSKTQRSRGWRIFRVSFAVFGVVLAIFIVLEYIYNW